MKRYIRTDRHSLDRMAGRIIGWLLLICLGLRALAWVYELFTGVNVWKP